MKYNITKIRDNDINSAIEVMKENFKYQGDAQLGLFWYDPIKKECYGVNKVYPEDVQYYESPTFNTRIKTIRTLHETVWKKESFRKKDPRFSGDYTTKPRGRIFYFEDKGFVVCVGNWISNYPEAKLEIISEFDLPENVEFKIDSHWDIGHGWSQEL